MEVHLTHTARVNILRDLISKGCGQEMECRERTSHTTFLEVRLALSWKTLGSSDNPIFRISNGPYDPKAVLSEEFDLIGAWKPLCIEVIQTSWLAQAKTIASAYEAMTQQKVDVVLLK